MSLIYNGTVDPDIIIYNGVELDEVVYNGVVVWSGFRETLCWDYPNNYPVNFNNYFANSIYSIEGDCVSSGSDITKYCLAPCGIISNHPIDITGYKRCILELQMLTYGQQPFKSGGTISAWSWGFTTFMNDSELINAAGTYDSTTNMFSGIRPTNDHPSLEYYDGVVLDSDYYKCGEEWSKVSYNRKLGYIFNTNNTNDNNYHLYGPGVTSLHDSNPIYMRPITFSISGMTGSRVLKIIILPYSARSVKNGIILLRKITLNTVTVA